MCKNMNVTIEGQKVLHHLCTCTYTHTHTHTHIHTHTCTDLEHIVKGSHEHVVEVMRHKHVAVADLGFGRVRAQGMGGSVPTAAGGGGCKLAHPVRLTPYTFTIVVFLALIISYQLPLKLFILRGGS